MEQSDHIYRMPPHSDKLLEFHMLAQDWTKPYAGEELIRIHGSVYEK